MTNATPGGLRSTRGSPRRGTGLCPCARPLGSPHRCGAPLQPLDFKVHLAWRLFWAEANHACTKPACFPAPRERAEPRWRLAPRGCVGAAPRGAGGCRSPAAGIASAASAPRSASHAGVWRAGSSSWGAGHGNASHVGSQTAHKQQRRCLGGFQESPGSLLKTQPPLLPRPCCSRSTLPVPKCLLSPWLPRHWAAPGGLTCRGGWGPRGAKGRARWRSPPPCRAVCGLTEPQAQVVACVHTGFDVVVPPSRASDMMRVDIKLLWPRLLPVRAARSSLGEGRSLRTASGQVVGSELAWTWHCVVRESCGSAALLLPRPTEVGSTGPACPSARRPSCLE